jgi:outer membrane lipoprotein-sorting protein
MTRFRALFLALAAFATTLAAVPAVAQKAPARAALTQAQSAALQRVHAYFNGVRYLSGDFTQIGPDGNRTTGKFFLSKPGKIRFYYASPSTIDIIADGKSLVVRDRRLNTQDVYPLGQTPLRFLLQPDLNLQRDANVVAVYDDPNTVSVAIEEKSTIGGTSRLLLVFGGEGGSLELKQWTVTDPQGLDTTVSVSGLDGSTKPDDKLFVVNYQRDVLNKR